MCYVAAIKKASAHYDERKAEMEAAEKNENLMHKLNADKLYEEGLPAQHFAGLNPCACRYVEEVDSTDRFSGCSQRHHSQRTGSHMR